MTSGLSEQRSMARWATVVEDWCLREPDAAFVAELRRALDAGDLLKLERYLGGALQFGTAGLRGPVGWGSDHMNEAVVIRASWGLGRFLLGQDPGADACRRVVVGFDARPESASFARLCAEVLSGLGIFVSLSERPVPTPLVAYLVRALRAGSGVVITASHNPRGDNGFKVYDEQGIQIVSPWDSEIAAFMGQSPPLDLVVRSSERVEPIQELDCEAYLEQVASTARSIVPEVRAEHQRIAYTPLHGVGRAWVEAAFRAALPQAELRVVAEQAEPDGDFPTTPFPNPEEKGTLDLLLRTSLEADCELAMANDPDADRMAACLRDEEGHFFQLSGDALGLLFADACLRTTHFSSPVLVSTIVSSPALDALAKAREASVVRTLTGFKWICRAAMSAPQFVFAYEEAIGYCFAAPPGKVGVLDKDGVCAAVVLGRMLAASGTGRELFDRLRDLYREIGLFGSFGRSQRFAMGERPAQEEMERCMAQLRLKGPTLGDDWKIEAFEDFSRDAERRPTYLGHQDLLCFDLARPGGGAFEPTSARILVRPSGTEPKVKLYVHLRGDWQDGQSLPFQFQRLEQYVEPLRSAFLRGI